MFKSKPFVCSGIFFIALIVSACVFADEKANGTASPNAGFYFGYFGLCGFLGLVGQIVRVSVGMKKINDLTTNTGKTFSQLFDWTQFVVSLFIGLGAGVVYSVITSINYPNLATTDVVGVIMAGYAGSDFLEGFIQKESPPGSPSASPTGTTTTMKKTTTITPATTANGPSTTTEETQTTTTNKLS